MVSYYQMMFLVKQIKPLYHIEVDVACLVPYTAGEKSRLVLDDR